MYKADEKQMSEYIQRRRLIMQQGAERAMSRTKVELAQKLGREGGLSEERTTGIQERYCQQVDQCLVGHFNRFNYHTRKRLQELSGGNLNLPTGRKV